MNNSNYSEASTVQELAEAAGLMPKYLDMIKKSVAAATDKIKAEGAAEGAGELGLIADKLTRMISIFGIIHRDTRSLGPRNIGSEENIKQIKIHLLSILKAVKTAENNRDSTMLVDLLEYELQDNLTQWKIKAIPQIKEMIQAASF